MSGTGLTVPCMTNLPRRYDVTITVGRDGGDHPNPAEFAVAAGQAASARAASIVSAHTGCVISTACDRRMSSSPWRAPSCGKPH